MKSKGEELQFLKVVEDVHARKGFCTSFDNFLPVFSGSVVRKRLNPVHFQGKIWHAFQDAVGMAFNSVLFITSKVWAHAVEG